MLPSSSSLESPEAQPMVRIHMDDDDDADGTLPQQSRAGEQPEQPALSLQALGGVEVAPPPTASAPPPASNSSSSSTPPNGPALPPLHVDASRADRRATVQWPLNAQPSRNVPAAITTSSSAALPPMHTPASASSTPGSSGSGSGTNKQRSHQPLAFLASFNSSFTYEQRDQAESAGFVTSRSTLPSSSSSPRTNRASRGTNPLGSPLAADPFTPNGVPPLHGKPPKEAVPGRNTWPERAAGPAAMPAEAHASGSTSHSSGSKRGSSDGRGDAQTSSESTTAFRATSAVDAAVDPVGRQPFGSAGPSTPATGAQPAASASDVELMELPPPQQQQQPPQLQQGRRGMYQHSRNRSEHFTASEQLLKPQPGLVSEAPSPIITPQITPHTKHLARSISAANNNGATLTAAQSTAAVATAAPSGDPSRRIHDSNGTGSATDGTGAASPGAGGGNGAGGGGGGGSAIVVSPTAHGSKPLPKAGAATATNKSAAVGVVAADGGVVTKPVTCLRFWYAFLILTLLQVALCCFVVWYICDTRARKIVAALSEEIRGDILSKVRQQVTVLLTDALNSADQLYTTIEAQQPLVAALATGHVSTANTSYLFPISVILAKFNSVPAVGIMGGSEVLLAVRRPALVQGYLVAASDSSTAIPTATLSDTTCPDENDGSGGCFFYRHPSLNTLVQDPDEIHEYGIRERWLNGSQLANSTMGYPDDTKRTARWAFNRVAYEAFVSGQPKPAWDPMHTQADFAPDLDSATTSQQLRDYADFIYDAAVLANDTTVYNANNPFPSPSTARDDFGTYPEYKQKPVWMDGSLLGGRLGWTRTFIAANSQVVIGAVKAMLNPAAPSEEPLLIAYTLLYYSSMNANILAQLRSTFRTRQAVAAAEVVILEHNGLLVATTLSDVSSNAAAIGRTDIYTTSHPFLSALSGHLIASGMIDGDLSNNASAVNVSRSSSRKARAYDSLLIDQSFRVGGTDWHVRAAPVTSAVGLRWVVAVATKDSDFNGDFAATSVATAWSSGLVGLGCIILTLLVVQCLTRPLLKLVSFMEDISWRLLLAKNDPLKQNADLLELQTLWQSSIDNPHLLRGNVDEELEMLRRRRRRAMKKKKKEDEEEAHNIANNSSSISKRRLGNARGTTKLGSASLMQPPSGTAAESDRDASPSSRARDIASSESSHSGDSDSNSSLSEERKARLEAKNKDAAVRGEKRPQSKQHKRAASSGRPAPSNNCCVKFGRSLRHLCCSRIPRFITRYTPMIALQETQLLHRTFGAMLSGLQASHGLLQTANESKRRFIRYIFHEVRVPFNAIVLGVEQLREDLYTEPLRPTEEMQDVVNILNEQSKVVARILNDVLSLQKIEDGALTLEMAPFNLIDMICGTLRSFQPLLAEKNLVLMTDFEDVDQALVRRQREEWIKQAATASGGKAIAHDSASAEEHKQSSAVVPLSDVRVDTMLPGPLSTVITPSPPEVGSADSTVTGMPREYLNAYEDSKELARIAESVTREVIGDRYRLRQVLANFLSNAVKFSPRGGQVIVRVTCAFLPDDDREESHSDVSVNGGDESDDDEGRSPAPAGPSRKSQKVPKPSSTRSANLDPPTAASGSVVLAPPGASPTTTDNSSAATTAGTPSAALTDGTPVVASPGTALLANSAQPAAVAAAELKPATSAHKLPNQWVPPRRVVMRVSVTDSGRGLSSAELPLLFQPYVQFQSGEQQQGKGTGLGLNISRSLVELHGGVIGVNSAGVPGEGCEFFFEIPMQLVASGDSRSTHTPANSNSPPRASSSRSNSTLRRNQAAANAGSTASPAMHAHTMSSGGVPLSADAALAQPEGLRMWHSPRSVARQLQREAIVSTSQSNSQAGGGGVQSHQSSPYSRRTFISPSVGGQHVSAAAEMAAKRLSGPQPTDLDGAWNLPDLYDRERPTQQGQHSTESTPSMGPRRGFAGSSHSAMAQQPAGEQASFAPIIPAEHSTETNLQYMSQLSFLSSLALQGHSAAPGPSASSSSSALSTAARVSPLQQYRATVLAGQGVPYGVGYPARTMLSDEVGQPIELGEEEDPEGAMPPELPQQQTRVNVSGPSSQRRDAATPASSPLQPSSSLAAGDPPLDPSVFNTSPFLSQSDQWSNGSPHMQSATLVPPAQPSSAMHSAVPSPNESSRTLGASSAASTACAAGTAASPSGAASSVPASTASSSSSASAAAAVGPAKPKVLVVEDSIPNRKLLMMLLRALKCDPSGAENGLLAVQEFEPSITDMDSLQAALRSGFKSAGAAAAAAAAGAATPGASPAAAVGAKGSEYALVLIDGNMPVLNGMDATRAIRSLGWRVPIVAVTGNALEEDARDFKDAGANDLVSKPVQRAALEAMLAKFIPGWTTTQSVAQAKINQGRHR